MRQLTEEDAIEASYEASDEKWRSAAEDRIDTLARRGNPFTSEDVIRYLDYRGLETPNMCALGSMFRRRQNAGIIKPVGWLTATRKERHHAPIRVWRGI